VLFVLICIEDSFLGCVQRYTDIRPGRYIWPIFGFCRYIGIGQNGRFYRLQQVLTKRCHIPHVFRHLAQESTMNQVKTVISQQRQQVRFHKQARLDEPWCTRRPSQPKKASSLIRLIANHCKISKLLQFEIF